MEKGIQLDHIYYKYDNLGEGGKDWILQDVCLEIKQGEFVGILGQTGSGKTTLMQHINGLLKPTQGLVCYKGENIHEGKYPIREHRMKVAYCFQYPEYQLFEETVLKDICFGLKNQGLQEELCIQKAKEAMKLLDLPESLEEISPFTLSGGQRRKVALAGLLAMDPEVLLLDEPVAGLDYRGKKNLFRILHRLNEEQNMTIVLVSHNMNEIAEHAKRVLILKNGRLLADGPVHGCLSRKEILLQAGLAMPDAMDYYYKLQDYSMLKADFLPMTVKELADYIAGEIV